MKFSVTNVTLGLVIAAVISTAVAFNQADSRMDLIQREVELGHVDTIRPTIFVKPVDTAFTVKDGKIDTIFFYSFKQVDEYYDKLRLKNLKDSREYTYE